MDEITYAERNFDDLEDSATQNFAAWCGRARLIALWLLMLLPMAWGVVETLKDIKRSDPSSIISIPSSFQGRETHPYDRSVIPRNMHSEFRAAIARR